MVKKVILSEVQKSRMRLRVMEDRLDEKAEMMQEQRWFLDLRTSRCQFCRQLFDITDIKGVIICGTNINDNI